VTERWSNGQVEGQINRLKTIKRAMYCRAGIEFLRARMLPAAGLERASLEAEFAEPVVGIEASQSSADNDGIQSVRTAAGGRGVSFLQNVSQLLPRMTFRDGSLMTGAVPDGS
jgi:hypothetical protein